MKKVKTLLFTLSAMFAPLTQALEQEKAIEHKDCIIAWMNASSIFSWDTPAGELIYEVLQQKGYRIEDRGYYFEKLKKENMSFWEDGMLYSVVSSNFMGLGSDCHLLPGAFFDELSCYIRFTIYYINNRGNHERLAHLYPQANGWWNKSAVKNDFFQQLREQMEKVPVCQVK